MGILKVSESYGPMILCLGKKKGKPFSARIWVSLKMWCVDPAIYGIAVSWEDYYVHIFFAQTHAPAIPSISPLISPLYIHYVPFIAPPKKRCRTINKLTIKLWWSTFPIIFVWGDLGVAIYDVFLVVKRDTPRPWSTHQTRAFLEFLPGGTLRVGVLSSWFPGCSPTKKQWYSMGIPGS